MFQTIEEVESFLIEDNPFEGRPWVLPDYTEDADVIVIASTPAYQDLQAKRVFTSEAGRVIRKMMLELGLRTDWLTGTPFIPEGRMKVKEARVFPAYVAEAIRRSGAKRVVMFGKDAVAMTPMFTEEFKRLSDLYNRNIKCGEYTFRVFPHMSTLARDPSQYEGVQDGIKRLVLPEPVKAAVAPPRELYTVHTTRETAEKALEACGELVACDVESTGLDIFRDKLLTIQLSWREGEGHSFRWDLFTPQEWGDFLRTKKLIFQNGSFDARILAANGVRVHVHEDTMLMHSLIDETVGTHSMDQMAQRYLGIDKWDDIINYDAMEENDEQTLGEYGARDTDITLRLANVFRPKMAGRKVYNVLHDAYNAIIDSSIFGVKVDREKAQQFHDDIEAALHDRKIMIADSWGLENPNSPQQVAKLLYEDMGLPVQKLNNRPTTNEGALSKLSEEFSLPVLDDILEYRALTKTNGTYLKAILRESEYDGRYHGDFKLAATETGRLTEPLLLLIPRPSGFDSGNLGRQYQYRLRELFIPDEGHVMIGADYSGLEVGMAAHIAADVQLIRDVRNRVDTHSVVAIEAFGLDIPLEPYETLKARVEENHTNERNMAKAGVFAWLYGGDENTIARNLGIDKDLALDILNALRNLYRGVANWHELTHAQVMAEGVVSTPWGRRRHFNFNSVFSREVIAAQLRESTNMPIQGMASDMNLAAFADIRRRGVRTLFPFHDAVYAQAPEEVADEAVEIIRDSMESALRGPVPFRTDINIGLNWGEL